MKLPPSKMDGLLEMVGKKLGVSTMHPSRERIPISSLAAVAPNRDISPEVGRVWPVSIRIRVVLPAPFFPTRPKIWPSFTSREAWFTAGSL